MSRHLRIAVTALTLNSLAFGPALAQSTYCRRAAELSGEDVTGLSDTKCQEMLQMALEDRWQLQLDAAIAAELGGEDELAWLRLNIILKAIEASDVPLSKAWSGVKDDIKETLTRLEEGLLVKHGRLNITTDTQGLLVSIAGVPAYEEAEFAPVTRFLKPGKHTVIVTATLGTGAESRHEIELKAGEVKDLSLNQVVAKVELPKPPVEPLVPVLDEKPPVRVNPPAQLRPMRAPVKEESSAWKTVGAIAVAGGAAALVTGGLFGLKAEQMSDEVKCWGEACADRDALRAKVKQDKDELWDNATISLIAGGVLLVGGILALTLSDSEESVQVAPWFSPEGGGVVGSLRF